LEALERKAEESRVSAAAGMFARSGSNELAGGAAFRGGPRRARLTARGDPQPEITGSAGQVEPCPLRYCYAHLLRNAEDLEKEFPDQAEV